MAETGFSGLTQLNGDFKVVYNKDIVNALPDNAILQKRFPDLTAATKLGLEYRTPITLSHEGGFTYLGESGDLTDLANAVSLQMREASIKGTELNLRGVITNKAIGASLGGGDKAFKKAATIKALAMNASMRHRIEASLLYGQSGIGTVASINDLGGNSGEIVITDASWAPGMWIGTEGASIDSFTGTTKNNASAALVITKVNLDLKKLTVTYSGTFSSEVAVSDVLFFTGSNLGSNSFAEMVGLQKILTNTGSLFGIDASAFSMWAGNSSTSVGDASFKQLLDAAIKPANRGCAQTLVALVPTKYWSQLNADEAALRRYDASKGDTAKNGFKSLEFEAANGTLQVVKHPMVKEGDMFLLPENEVVRVGAYDVTFALDGETFFRPLEKQNGFMMQADTDQALFLTKPSYGLFGTGVSYS